MIAGHFGLAAAVKAKSPQTPLWALMLATQWLDVVFAPLLACGIEGFAPLAGAKPGAYGALVIHADYTHSLIGALLLACLFGALAQWRYGKQNGCVLGGVVLSHYVLDLLVHRADMPIVPGARGALGQLGFGLWQYPVASALVELLLVVVGTAMYWQAAKLVAGADTAHQKRAHRCGATIGFAGLLTLGLNFFGQLGATGVCMHSNTASIVAAASCRHESWRGASGALPKLLSASFLHLPMQTKQIVLPAFFKRCRRYALLRSIARFCR